MYLDLLLNNFLQIYTRQIKRPLKNIREKSDAEGVKAEIKSIEVKMRDVKNALEETEVALNRAQRERSSIAEHDKGRDEKIIHANKKIQDIEDRQLKLQKEKNGYEHEKYKLKEKDKKANKVEGAFKKDGGESKKKDGDKKDDE